MATIASVAVEVVPDASKFFPTLRRDLAPTITGLSQGMSQELTSTVRTSVTKSVSEATKSVASGVTSTVDKALSGASFGQVLSASLRNNSAALGELERRAGAAGASIRTLGTRALSLRAVSQAASGLGASLGGVASVLGAGGPWAIALAGAGIGLAAFQQAQENASKATQEFTATLDRQTGALTAKSVGDLSQKLRENIQTAKEWEQLSSVGFGMKESLVAFYQGGRALDAYREKLRAYGADHPEIVHLTDALDSALQNLSETAVDSSDAWRLDKIQADAAAAAIADVGAGADSTVTSLANLTAGTRQSMAGFMDLQGQLIGVDAAMQNVRAAINATPKDVTISASGVGFDAVLAQIQAVQAALSVLKYGIDTTSPSYSGGDHTGLAADHQPQSVKDAQKRYEAAWKRLQRAQRAIDKHNLGVSTGVSTSGGGGGGSAGSAGASAAKSAVDAARKQLRKSLGKGFVAELVASSPQQIKDAANDLIDQVRAAFNGKQEKQLVADIRSGSAAMRAAARERDRITENLQTAQDNAAQIRSDSIGSFTDRTWTAKGVREWLKRRLDHLRIFRASLGTLAKRGLPQDFLNGLIQAGSEAAWKTAQNLAASDDTLFNEIKSEATALVQESTQFGNFGAGLLYGAGADTAQGLIDGWKSKRRELEDEIRDTAKAVDKDVRKALGGAGGKGDSKKPKPGGGGKAANIYNLNVDARGAGDPQAVKNVVAQAFREFERTTAAA